MDQTISKENIQNRFVITKLTGKLRSIHIAIFISIFILFILSTVISYFIGFRSKTCQTQTPVDDMTTDVTTYPISETLEQSCCILNANNQLDFQIMISADKKTALNIINWSINEPKYTSIGFAVDRYDSDLATTINTKAELRTLSNPGIKLRTIMKTSHSSAINLSRDTTETVSSYMDILNLSDAFGGYENEIELLFINETDRGEYSVSTRDSINGVRIVRYYFGNSSYNSPASKFEFYIDIGEDGRVYGLNYETIVQKILITSIEYNKVYDLPITNLPPSA